MIWNIFLLLLFGRAFRLCSETLRIQSYYDLANTQKKLSQLNSPTNLSISRPVNKPVLVTPYHSLNTSKGVVYVTLLNVKWWYIWPLVESLRSNTITKGNESVETITIILTFANNKPPGYIHAVYISSSSEHLLSISPLCCFQCQKFDHHRQRCTESTICSWCGVAGHDGTFCSSPPDCTSCEGPHPAFPKNCPHWLLEKEIHVYRIRATQNISYLDAHWWVVSSTTMPHSISASYAEVKKKTVNNWNSNWTLLSILWRHWQTNYCKYWSTLFTWV